MSHRSSRELIIKAIKLVQILERGRPIDAYKIADELEITRSCGRQWLEAACSVMPIYSPNEESRSGDERKLYQLL